MKVTLRGPNLSGPIASISVMRAVKSEGEWTGSDHSVHTLETHSIRGLPKFAHMATKGNTAMGSTARLGAIESVRHYRAPAAIFPAAEPPGEIFGENVFTKAVMQKRLPKPVFKSVMATIEHSKPLDPTVADVVAVVMKDWAMEKGATHYAHVFYPLTHLTAEKHDSFFEPGGDGSAIAEFAGQDPHPRGAGRVQLPQRRPAGHIRGPGLHRLGRDQPGLHPREPQREHVVHPDRVRVDDRGGPRQQDPAAAVPTGHGQAGGAHPALFGHEDPDAVVSFAGAEQEYFLIDRSFFLTRPDLLNSGRTLFGAKPPKGQEFDDHYFGAIPERVLAYMMDCERELFKLGIPAKTRHNEVAPGQFELAPMFERSNVAADHQQLLMTTLKRVAQKHGMECLFHEKPFEGINGSGKHVNFSLGNSTQGNLLLPGDTPHDNAQFLVFCAAVIRSVHKYGGLLRASVASATNDHRLGANEAPPAIISIFLGDQLADVFDQIAAGRRHLVQGEGHSRNRGRHAPGAAHRSRVTATGPARSPSPATASSSGPRARCSRSPARWSPSTPSWPRPSTTSPPSSKPLATEGDRVQCRRPVRPPDIIKDHGAVVFNDDGYADEWQVEAAERGLPNLKTTLDALPELITEESMDLFSQLWRLQPPRDAQSLRDRTRAVHPLHPRRSGSDPRDGQHHHPPGRIALPDRVGPERLEPGGHRPGGRHCHPGRGVGLAQGAAVRHRRVSARRSNSTTIDTEEKRGEHAQKGLLPAMAAVRAAADSLETLVADDLWPLPTYQEMLFIL